MLFNKTAIEEVDSLLRPDGKQEMLFMGLSII